jgi:hypothetical protein
VGRRIRTGWNLVKGWREPWRRCRLLYHIALDLPHSLLGMLCQSRCGDSFDEEDHQLLISRRFASTRQNEDRDWEVEAVGPSACQIIRHQIVLELEGEGGALHEDAQMLLSRVLFHV